MEIGTRVPSGRLQCPLDRGGVREVVFGSEGDLAAHNVVHRNQKTLLVASDLDERCGSSSEDDDGRVTD